MDKRLTPARIALIYAAFASVWIFASDKLLALAVPDSSLIIRIGMLKGFAFVLITAWLLYQLIKTSATKAVPADKSTTGWLKVRSLSGIFLVLALIVPLLGYSIARIYGPHIRQTAFSDLSAIAELKAGQVENWLRERDDDATEISDRAGLIQRAEQWLRNGDPDAKQFLLARMSTLARTHGYEMILLRQNGRQTMTSYEPDSVTDKIWHGLLKKALSSGKPQHSELYRDNTGEIHLDYVMPLRLSNPRRTVGALVLRAPIERFLFPLIQSWPTSSPSAEIVLTRREGNQVLYLNELRHRKGSALTLRLPIDTPDLPAASSILVGKPHTMEGVDYRNVRVLAATRPIQGTDWYLTAKVDRVEVMAPLYEMLLWVSLVAIVAVLIVTSAVLTLWRQQQRVHQMEMVARTAEKDKQLKLFYELPFIGMSITSPITRKWLYANDRLCDMLGYAQAELLQTKWTYITHPDDVSDNLRELERMISGESDGFRAEKRYIRKDGTPITVNADVKCVRDADGKASHIVALIEDITERKRAEQALRESEATYRSLFDNMMNGVAHCRMIYQEGVPVDYEYIAVNPGFEQITGLKDVVSKKVSEVIPGYCEQNKDSLEIFNNVATTGEPRRWEHHLAALNKWFTFNIYSPAHGEFVIVTDDISERMRAEQALRESEERFRNIFSSAVDGILIADTRSRKFIMSNPAIERMLGYDSDELLHLGLEDIHQEQDVSSNVALFEKMARGETTIASNIAVKRKDGSLFFADIKASPLTIANKPCLMGVFRDITERKKTEDALRQSAAVFESSHDGITITDLDGRILAVNSSFLKITGYSEAEVLGQNPRMLHSGRQSDDFYRDMWANIREAGYWHGEIWNRRKSGEVYPEWLTISTVKNSAGAPTHYVGTFSDLSQIKQSEERAEHLAHYDPLTELPNRLLIVSHLSHVLTRARRHPHQIAVLYIDLDRFKNVNESLGYPAGDEMLVKLTERLTMHMRSEDVLARIGGDEFLLVLENIRAPEDAAVVARTLLELLAQPIVLSGKQEVFVGASIGISIFPNDGDRPERLIQYADAAMHQAKRHGRNTYRFYTDALTRLSGEHLELETRLRHAVTDNQLRVYYQPQVDIVSGHIVGAEALVRWQDPERGLIPPGHFIPIAEETGVIDALGEWVLRETCSQGVRWIKAGMPFMTLAVNLSPRQFMRSNIADMVSNIIEETGFPPDRLELELTESALMQHEEEAVKMLHLLRALNIRLAIDDFGTGYSSLSYLKRFPLDVLKIDKSFVDDIPFHQDDMEIASTIIAMGHTLGYKVLAEGVETAEQLDFLKTKGCDMFQGYLTSPPVPAAEFEALLRKK